MPIVSVISLQRVGVERHAVAGAPGLLGERRDRLGAAGDAEVVDAGVVEDAGDQREELLAGGDAGGVVQGVLAHRVGRDARRGFGGRGLGVRPSGRVGVTM